MVGEEFFVRARCGFAAILDVWQEAAPQLCGKGPATTRRHNYVGLSRRNRGNDHAVHQHQRFLPPLLRRPGHCPGLSRDGGLFLPETIPALTTQDLQALVGMTYQQRAVKVMKAYLDEFTEEELAEYAAKAYAVPGKFDDAAVTPIHSTHHRNPFSGAVARSHLCL